MMAVAASKAEAGLIASSGGMQAARQLFET
jgi:hypothetical protein